MGRSMLNISLRDRVPNHIRKKKGVADAVIRIITLKWIWACHDDRVRNERWTKKFLEWRPTHDVYCAPGRPKQGGQTILTASTTIECSRPKAVDWFTAVDLKRIWMMMMMMKTTLAVWGRALSCNEEKFSPTNGVIGMTWSVKHSWMLCHIHFQVDNEWHHMLLHDLIKVFRVKKRLVNVLNTRLYTTGQYYIRIKITDG